MSAAPSALANSLENLRRQLRLVESLRRLGSISLDSGAGGAGGAMDDAVRQVQTHLGTPAELASYHYNATIVSLYGLLERYVEDLLSEIVRAVAKAVPTSAQLPPRIRSHHLPLTLEVLNALEAKRYKGTADSASLISTLNGYLAGSAGVHVNDQVFTYHTANFRSDVIRQSCERVGFSPVQDLRDDPEYLTVCSDRFPDEDNVFFVVDDLSERRNEVAHGSPPQQLLTGSLLLAYVDVVEAYL